MSRRGERGTQEERDRSTQLSVLKVSSIAQTPTKIQRFSVEIRLFEIKYLKTKTKTPNLEICMEFSLKIGLLSSFYFCFFFFCKVIVR